MTNATQFSAPATVSLLLALTVTHPDRALAAQDEVAQIVSCDFSDKYAPFSIDLYMSSKTKFTGEAYFRYGKSDERQEVIQESPRHGEQFRVIMHKPGGLYSLRVIIFPKNENGLIQAVGTTLREKDRSEKAHYPGTCEVL